MTENLNDLIADFGGGRKKQSEKSQLYYDLARNVLSTLEQKSYLEVENFTEYLIEVAKRVSVVNVTGREAINQ